MKRHFRYVIPSGSFLILLQFAITKISEINMPFSHQIIISALILIIVNGIVFYLLRDKKRIKTDQYIAPFEDAIANIHLGDANHIFIMKSFFRAQEEAIAILKSKIASKKTLKLQKTWDEYKKHYEGNAKERIHTLFAVFSEPFKTKEIELLHKYLSDIIKEIKRLT